MSTIIRAEQLSMQFQDVMAVDGISFEVQSGEIYGFLGTNGAGKTTTIKCLIGLHRPTSGKIEIMGETNMDRIHPHIGVVTESQKLYGDLTVFQNIEFFGKLYGKSSKLCDEMIEELDLVSKRDTKASKLSSGLKQRVLLARSILHQPKILFLDEPTSGLDPNSAQKVYQFIRKMKEAGTTIFLTTHYMDEADALCDRVTFIDEGKIVKTGIPCELKKEFGEKKLEVTYSMDGQVKIDTLPLEAQSFDRIKDYSNLLSVHSKEASMREIFIKLTGGQL